MSVTNLIDAFEAVTEHWSPRVVGRVNDQFLKLAKVQGEFVWHKHEQEDELFYVVKGELIIEYQDRPPVRIRQGEFHIVPKAVMHNPRAEQECWLMLIEPITTKHTGELVIALTRSIEEQLGVED